MIQAIFAQHSPFEWALAFLAALAIGFSKAGLRGIDALNVTLMALVFSSKESTGIVLPLLCLADILAVIHYSRHANWLQIKILAPWIICGVIIGWYIGKGVDEGLFKTIMAVVILFAIGIMLWLERNPTHQFSKSKPFAVAMGLISGFTTMIGNLAGIFSNIYFLALRFPKNEFIGTVSWLFLLINFFKIPFHVFSWHTITSESLLIDLTLSPAVVFGFYSGAKLVKYIQNTHYRHLILGLTILGAILILTR